MAEKRREGGGGPYLVSGQSDDNVGVCLPLELLYPSLGLVERSLVVKRKKWPTSDCWIYMCAPYPTSLPAADPRAEEEETNSLGYVVDNNSCASVSAGRRDEGKRHRREPRRGSDKR